MAQDWTPDVTITYGSTYENLQNLAEPLKKRILSQYEGTTSGRQELHGELLDAVTGALWQQRWIDTDRITLDKGGQLPPFLRVVVGVDPMVTNIALEETIKSMGAREETATAAGGSETGIVVAALGMNRHCYVLDDRSLSASPLGWAQEAIQTMKDWKGDRLIGEENNGGALIETTLRSFAVNVPYKSVKASQGKLTRAEPVSALYEKHRVHHVGTFPKLEKQLVTYRGDPKQKSPDRLDALVWAVTELMLGDNYTPIVDPVLVTGSNPWDTSNG